MGSLPEGGKGCINNLPDKPQFIGGAGGQIPNLSFLGLFLRAKSREDDELIHYFHWSGKCKYYIMENSSL